MYFTKEELKYIQDACAMYENIVSRIYLNNNKAISTADTVEAHLLQERINDKIINYLYGNVKDDTEGEFGYNR